MTTQRNRPRPGHLRRLPSGPTAFLIGTDDEIVVLEPLLQKAGIAVLAQEIDPMTLDVEAIVLDETLTARVETAAMAIIVADVSGDDRLPLISFIDDALPADRLLLASCSQAGVNEQAAICQHRERVVGFGPLGILSGRQVVEVSPGYNTTSAMLERSIQLFESAGLAVHQVTDTPGMVLGRMLMPIVNEATFALAEGMASAEDIDNAMRLGANYPFGPLRWADEIGLDRVLLAMEYLVQATHEERYRPAPLLRRLAHAGYVGKKAGRGFYTYGQSAPTSE
ncbi:MAG: 3-hydroxybutyryl-CoA dehydrogenase [Chloroflexi bacterium]|jgi:3-hydroxybutyryl-CoA dehydrogenase|nr:3-hydroxybutyryl-CoA dehydrogenase [Chloroflexota bacterium]